jgi:hypothetical protein
MKEDTNNGYIEQKRRNMHLSGDEELKLLQKIESTD